MAARIIHFGLDDCYRLRILQNAGFVVEDCGSLDQLRAALQKGEPVAAIVLTERDRMPSNSALAIGATWTSAPFILFQGTRARCDVSAFDLVIQNLTHPQVWLRTIEDLLRGGSTKRCRMLPRRRQRCRARKRLAGSIPCAGGICPA